MVVRDNLNYHIRSLLREAYERWDREQKNFIKRREEALAQFMELRTKEALEFELHQSHELERIRQQLNALGETYDAPGRPLRKGSRFAWG